MARSQVKHVAAHISARGESIFNLCLICATSVHEWGNAVGYTAAPLAVAILLHIICDIVCGED